MFKQASLGALLATSCLVLPGGQALAQQAAGAPAPVSGAQSPGSVAEIVVQAERRSEPLQEVPAAVSVVTADLLKATNYSGLTQLQFLSPAIQFNMFGGGSWEIRGVGNTTYNTSQQGEVGVVVDDVVIGTPEVSDIVPFYTALSDINHIEVLEGPQGTLFGKNAAAGVIQIITNPPVLGAYTNDTTIAYGSRNLLKLNDVVNIPLGDTVAVRLAAYDYGQDGAEYNAYSKQDIGNYYQRGIRLNVLWQPNDRFSADVIAYYTEASDDGNGLTTLRSCGAGDLTFLEYFQPCSIERSDGVIASRSNTAQDVNAPTYYTNENAGVSVHLNYDIGPGTLKSITAYQNLSERGAVDVDQTPTSFLDVDQTWVNSTEVTQELRYSSLGERRLEYTGGLFFYYVGTQDVNTLAGTLGLEPDDSPNFLDLYGPGALDTIAHTYSYAAYFQGTYHLTNKFSLIGGMRYTYDDVNSREALAPEAEADGKGLCQITYFLNELGVPTPCSPATYPLFPPYSPTASIPFTLPTRPIGDTVTASNLSGKVGVQYTFTPDIMAYFTFATGYKGPEVAFTSGSPYEGAALPVKPETSTDYELGLKSEFLEHRLLLDVDAFYTLFHDFQVETYYYNTAEPALSGSILTNAGGLATRGVEGNAEFKPTSEWTFSGNFAYSPATFTSYNIECSYGPSGAGPWANSPIPGAPRSCFMGPGNVLLFSAKGYPLANAPTWSYSLMASYKHEIADNYRFDASLNWHWRSSTYTLVADPNTIVPAYGVLDGQIGIGPSDGRWRFSLWAQNLLNQYFVAGIFPSFFDDGTGTGLAHPVRGYSNVLDLNDALRTFGVKLEYHFGS